jgi:hypothetical protein
VKIRGWTLALLVLMVFTLGAQFAFASNPSTSLGGCMKAWTPYTVASGANTIMQAHSYNSGCYGGAFRNCLERSSWSGYVTLRCNAWHLTSQIHDEKVSGCLKGTYDYHTFHDYAAPDGQTHFYLFSEARKAYKCLVTV